MAANLLATATAIGVPTRLLMGFVDHQVNQLIGIDGQREASLCLIPIARSDHPASRGRTTPAPPLPADTALVSGEEIDYPEMMHLHVASALSTPEDVVIWRGGSLVRLPEPRVGSPYPLEPAALVSSPLGEVIRQRGSTRRFARGSISFAHLSAILAHATTGIPADFLDSHGAASLLHLYLIVNAVEGIPSGGYVFSPDTQTLDCLQTGEFRQEAGHLCFEQALGADASVVVFFMADLNAVLHRLGNRGYRAVQLEAGTIGGKMYLCAYALGLGASGLTFFDDEVTAFFAPHAEGKSAIFVVALGHTATENRVRPFRSRVGMVIDALSRRDAPA
jgi:SagB-type dehydrogenase family enzyme